MKYFTANLVKLPGIQVRLLLNFEVKFTEHLSIFTVQLNTTLFKLASVSQLEQWNFRSEVLSTSFSPGR